MIPVQDPNDPNQGQDQQHQQQDQQRQTPDGGGGDHAQADKPTQVDPDGSQVPDETGTGTGHGREGT